MKRNNKRYWLGMMLCWSFLLWAQQPDLILPFEQAYKRTYPIERVSDAKLTMDGRLDEPLWMHQGTWTDWFVQVSP